MSKRLIITFFLLITLPYLVAYLASGAHYNFAGFLLNPLDGNSYLAKMYEGWRLECLFRLPYTADPGNGAYLYSFYLVLGATARFLQLPLILVYHLARFVGAIILLHGINRFFKAACPDKKLRGFAFTLALLGLGMGWLVFFTGQIASDFWVAEAYPFLSAYSSPHFTFSLALMLWLLLPSIENQAERENTRGVYWKRARTVVLTAILTSMSPFALVIVLGVLGVLLVWEYILDVSSFPDRMKKRSIWVSPLSDRWFSDLLWHYLWIFLGGAPVAIYSYLVIHYDPILSLWNAQNITPTPPIWDLLLAFSPALILALPGMYQSVRHGGKAGRLLTAWVFIVGVMVLLPFGLQRRFLIGVYIPLTLLAAHGLGFIENEFGPRVKAIHLAGIAMALPTTLIVILVGQFGVLKHDQLLYLTNGEAKALYWIKTNSKSDDLILASPRTGLFIPAWTGRRVIYGHPFETINAKTEQALVTEFFQTASSDPGRNRSFIEDRGVDWIFYGPSEKELGDIAAISGLEKLYDQSDVQIFRLKTP